MSNLKHGFSQFDKANVTLTKWKLYSPSETLLSVEFMFPRLAALCFTLPLAPLQIERYSDSGDLVREFDQSSINGTMVSQVWFRQFYLTCWFDLEM